MPSGGRSAARERARRCRPPSSAVPVVSAAPTVMTYGSSAGLEIVPAAGPWLPADDDDDEAGLPGALDRAVERVDAVAAGGVGSPREVDDADVVPGAVGDDPLQAGDDGRDVGRAVPAGDLDRDEPRLRGGALERPELVLPSPAMTPAMCVPWPKWSMPSRSLVRSTRATTRGPRFAVGVTPVSTLATVTPSPWYLFGTRSSPIARCQVASGRQRVVAGRRRPVGSRGRCASPHGRRSRRPRRKRRGAGPGRRSLGTRAAKAPASGSGRPTVPPSRRTVRSAAGEDGERSTTTTRAVRGAAVEAVRRRRAHEERGGQRQHRRREARERTCGRGGSAPILAGGRHATSG